MDEKQDVRHEPNHVKRAWQRFDYLPQSHKFWKIICLILLIVGVYCVYLLVKKQKHVSIRPTLVVSAESQSRDVPIYLSALGNVTPLYSVTVKTQINGQLIKVLFKEGQKVKQGELLAQIDARPYEALLEQYEGNLKRDTALLANANIDLARYSRLWKQNSISEQTLRTQQALVEQYEGAVKTDAGLIQGTKVNLTYCNITSPIDGTIGLRLVDSGNIVQTADALGIAVINTMQPMTVIFALAEDYSFPIRKQIDTQNALEVLLYDRQQNKELAKGALLSIDNQIDTTTGTFKLKGIFKNGENILFPNQFVNVKILADTLKQAILVPTAAIQHTNTNDFVFVINPNNTVTVTPVITGPISGEDTVITSGLKALQTVVVAGADKLKNGMPVVTNNAVVDKPTRHGPA